MWYMTEELPLLVLTFTSAQQLKDFPCTRSPGLMKNFQRQNHSKLHISLYEKVTEMTNGAGVVSKGCVPGVQLWEKLENVHVCLSM